MKYSKRNCLSCNQEFTPIRPNKKYCDNACRTRDYRRRKELGIKPIQNVIHSEKQQQTTPKQSTNNTQKIKGVVNGYVSLDVYLKAIEEHQKLLLETNKLEMEIEYNKKFYEEEIEREKSRLIEKLKEIENNNQYFEKVVDAIAKKMGI